MKNNCESCDTPSKQRVSGESRCSSIEKSMDMLATESTDIDDINPSISLDDESLLEQTKIKNEESITPLPVSKHNTVDSSVSPDIENLVNIEPLQAVSSIHIGQTYSNEREYGTCFMDALLQETDNPNNIDLTVETDQTDNPNNIDLTVETDETDNPNNIDRTVETDETDNPNNIDLTVETDDDPLVCGTSFDSPVDDVVYGTIQFENTNLKRPNTTSDACIVNNTETCETVDKDHVNITREHSDVTGCDANVLEISDWLQNKISLIKNKKLLERKRRLSRYAKILKICVSSKDSRHRSNFNQTRQTLMGPSTLLNYDKLVSDKCAIRDYYKQMDAQSTVSNDTAFVCKNAIDKDAQVDRNNARSSSKSQLLVKGNRQDSIPNWKPMSTSSDVSSRLNDKQNEVLYSRKVKLESKRKSWQKGQIQRKKKASRLQSIIEKCLLSTTGPVGRTSMGNNREDTSLTFKDSVNRSAKDSHLVSNETEVTLTENMCITSGDCTLKNSMRSSVDSSNKFRCTDTVSAHGKMNVSEILTTGSNAQTYRGNTSDHMLMPSTNENVDLSVDNARLVSTQIEGLCYDSKCLTSSGDSIHTSMYPCSRVISTFGTSRQDNCLDIISSQGNPAPHAYTSVSAGNFNVGKPGHIGLRPTCAFGRPDSSEYTYMPYGPGTATEYTPSCQYQGIVPRNQYAFSVQSTANFNGYGTHCMNSWSGAWSNPGFRGVPYTRCHDSIPRYSHVSFAQNGIQNQRYSSQFDWNTTGYTKITSGQDKENSRGYIYSSPSESVLNKTPFTRSASVWMPHVQSINNSQTFSDFCQDNADSFTSNGMNTSQTKYPATFEMLKENNNQSNFKMVNENEFCSDLNSYPRTMNTIHYRAKHNQQEVSKTLHSGNDVAKFFLHNYLSDKSSSISDLNSSPTSSCSDMHSYKTGPKQRFPGHGNGTTAAIDTNSHLHRTKDSVLKSKSITIDTQADIRVTKPVTNCHMSNCSCNKNKTMKGIKTICTSSDSDNSSIRSKSNASDRALSPIDENSLLYKMMIEPECSESPHDVIVIEKTEQLLEKVKEEPNESPHDVIVKERTGQLLENSKEEPKTVVSSETMKASKYHVVCKSVTSTSDTLSIGSVERPHVRENDIKSSDDNDASHALEICTNDKGQVDKILVDDNENDAQRKRKYLPETDEMEIRVSVGKQIVQDCLNVDGNENRIELFDNEEKWKDAVPVDLEKCANECTYKVQHVLGVKEPTDDCNDKGHSKDFSLKISKSAPSYTCCLGGSHKSEDVTVDDESELCDDEYAMFASFMTMSLLDDDVQNGTAVTREQEQDIDLNENYLDDVDGKQCYDTKEQHLDVGLEIGFETQKESLIKVENDCEKQSLDTDFVSVWKDSASKPQWLKLLSKEKDQCHEEQSNHGNEIQKQSVTESDVNAAHGGNVHLECRKSHTLGCTSVEERTCSAEDTSKMLETDETADLSHHDDSKILESKSLTKAKSNTQTEAGDKTIARSNTKTKKTSKKMPPLIFVFDALKDFSIKLERDPHVDEIASKLRTQSSDAGKLKTQQNLIIKEEECDKFVAPTSSESISDCSLNENISDADLDETTEQETDIERKESELIRQENKVLTTTAFEMELDSNDKVNRKTCSAVQCDNNKEKADDLSKKTCEQESHKTTSESIENSVNKEQDKEQEIPITLECMNISDRKQKHFHRDRIVLKLRVKERKTYTDAGLDDDDIEGKRSYKIEDKIANNIHNYDFVRKLTGEEFTLRYLQENGLQYPIIFKEKSGLGLRVPSDNFKVSDVKACVGSRRMLDVMDVNTQKGLEMTMKEWVKYYENTERNRLLNVISLEFSHTKLENYVESPNLVREVDWVDTAWPQHLKDCQTESTNAIDKMKYPKVQKYCLMSVQGCYTDFHIDFGGTSVWYHILHGEKIFWLIPPTHRNLSKYEHWVLSGKQGDAFLADSIDEFEMIRLVAGNTFIIPSGWIHAVYTPKDSLVFGGNFLHNFNMVNQLKVSAIEDKTHVPTKFRYPFYAEINWYVLERYVHSLTGVTYLEKPQLNEDLELVTSKAEKDLPNLEMLEEKLNKRLAVSLTRIDDASPRRRSTSDDDSTASGPTRSPGQGPAQPRLSRKSSSESANSIDLKLDADVKPKVPYKSPVRKNRKHVHLTNFELEGLIEVVSWIENLPASKKGIPKDLIDPETVLKEIKLLIKEHINDNPELAITGEPVLEWTRATKKLIKLKQKAKTAKLMGSLSGPKAKPGGKVAAGSRRRRVRCKQCEPCTREDCQECSFCKDMKKYGGPGRAKQSCISRQCLRPNLPNCVTCQLCNAYSCNLERAVKEDGATDEEEDLSTSLMECGLCWEIVHPLCLSRKFVDLNNEGVINEDLPNSWKCTKCCFDGKEGQLKTRVFKGGWRPNASFTPPPFSMSPPPHSEGSQDSRSQLSPGLEPANIAPGNIVTEGKRVTVNQVVDSKPSVMPILSSSPVKMEPSLMKLENSTDYLMGSFDRLNDTGVKVENQNPHLKSEPQDSSQLKRRLSPEHHSVTIAAKKKREFSPSPSKNPKSKPSTKPSPLSRNSPATNGKSPKESPLAASSGTKRSKRETVSGHYAYDFVDDELMDTSAPLPPEKGKGKSPKGKKSGQIKHKDVMQQSVTKLHTKSHSFPITDQKSGELQMFSAKRPLEKVNNEQLKQTLIEHISKRNLPIIKPRFAVRPAPIAPPDDYCYTINGHKHPLSRKLWTQIFHYLSKEDMAKCLVVCRIWNRWCINPALWKQIDLSRKRIVQAHLIGIVRRQPEYLNLSAVIMTQKQILWLLERLPMLRTLIVSKCSWATISGLCMSSCPLLYNLDISWATGLNDKCFEDLVMPPVDRKPAVTNVSRLHRLKSLNVSGSEITDMSLSVLSAHLTRLEHLNISYCTRITDQGILMMANMDSTLPDTLISLNISGCRQLTSTAIDAIKSFRNLTELETVNCIRIPMDKCRSLQQVRKFKKFKC